ncbi:signal peptidase I [Bacillus sp. V5-8f]|uniref:signal peptidase I n=1 Tax=Bacillus sp. V5-8f TaxID=2053044 RepID=UPI000C785B28|nr:signal peptidase I [Bacillus sp. V5-8f]PLT32892.1 signal peptidase I [Bacillus sp. V5-8f]
MTELKVKNRMRVKSLVIKATNILGIMLLLIFVYLILFSKISGGSPQFFGYQFMTILSGSMEPEINRGAVVLVKSMKDPAALQEGDVVTFRSPRDSNQLITHRIMDINEQGIHTEFITKGDANLTPDARPLSANLVVGKYQGVTFPYLGYLIEFMKSKLGLIIFLIIPAIYIIVSNIKYLQTVVSDCKEGAS